MADAKDHDVLRRIEALADRFRNISYGQLDYGGESYRLVALESRQFDPALSTALVTGGVHDYQTSGIMGALDFLENHAHAFLERINFLAVPCVSPWAYERINRWNYDAIDPNRNFRTGGAAQEAAALIKLVRSGA